MRKRVLVILVLGLIAVMAPAQAQAPPEIPRATWEQAQAPAELGCATYGCEYAHERTCHFTRTGENRCGEIDIAISYERLPDGGGVNSVYPKGREFIGVLFPDEYDPGRRYLWDKLAYCESTWRWYLDGRFDGGIQFSPATWRAYGGTEFAPYAYQAYPEQQIAIGERVLRLGHGPHGPQGPGAWPHCSWGVFR